MIQKITIIAFLTLGFLGCKTNTAQVKSEAKEKMASGADQKSDQDDTVKEQETSFKDSKGNTIQKVFKKPEEWSSQLNKQEFYVIRKKGTERAHTSALLNNKKEGIYTCKACDFPLFESQTKFKSGTGWPSFYQPIDEEHILEDTDFKIGYERTEVMCRKCEGHLGHVFKDGPNPTGLRYCINGVSLNFEEK